MDSVYIYLRVTVLKYDRYCNLNLIMKSEDSVKLKKTWIYFMGLAMYVLMSYGLKWIYVS
jgi:hypothetical protein